MNNRVRQKRLVNLLHQLTASHRGTATAGVQVATKTTREVTGRRSKVLHDKLAPATARGAFRIIHLPRIQLVVSVGTGSTRKLLHPTSPPRPSPPLPFSPFPVIIHIQKSKAADFTQVGLLQLVSRSTSRPLSVKVGCRWQTRSSQSVLRRDRNS